jgi:uncharacterized protein
MLDSLTVYVLAVIFVATLIRSTFGFGEALVAVPLLALRTPILIAAPLAVLISVMIAAVIVVQDWQRIEIRSATGLILSSLFGIPLGIWLLVGVDGQVVKLALGIVIIAFSIYSLTFRPKAQLRPAGRWWLVSCGFISGVLGGAYGMNGPPLAIYGVRRGWSPQHFRATLQGYFLPASLVGLVGYRSVGVWTSIVTRYFILSLPIILIAVLLGRMINHRLKDNGFFKLVYGGLVVIGAALIIQSGFK